MFHWFYVTLYIMDIWVLEGVVGVNDANDTLPEIGAENR